MATLTKGVNFASNEVVTPQKLNSLVDAATVSNIVNADISDLAAITDTKLNTISTPGKIANSATSATSNNSPNTIVLRDNNGKFSGTFAGKLDSVVITSEESINELSQDDFFLVFDASTSSIKKVSIKFLALVTSNFPYLEYAWVTTPNAGGQSVAANTVTVLTLNSEVADTAGIGNISNNQVTIPAGTYRYSVEVPCFVPYLEGQVYIRNTTANLFLAKHKWIGPSAGNTNQYWTYYPAHPLNGPFEGQFSLAAQSAIELQFLASSGVSIGINTGSYTIRSTVATADLDQRTTIKLWKVN